MDNTYIFSMQEHLTEIESDLEGLYEISKKRPLGRYEYRAAERSLQVLIETCIGIAKHWSYALNKTAPADAYTAFENLAQLGVDEIDTASWRKIIGMRNALVHDYLNIEPEIIRLVIKKRNFQDLLDFSNKGLIVLTEII
jgi:uncharacterized protein YutE (UPF0331/DUF86 family)